MHFNNKDVCGCIMLCFYAQENVQDIILLDNVLLHFFLPTKTKQNTSSQLLWNSDSVSYTTYAYNTQHML